LVRDLLALAITILPIDDHPRDGQRRTHDVARRRRARRSARRGHAPAHRPAADPR